MWMYESLCTEIIFMYQLNKSDQCSSSWFCSNCKTRLVMEAAPRSWVREKGWGGASQFPHRQGSAAFYTNGADMHHPASKSQGRRWTRHELFLFSQLLQVSQFLAKEPGWDPEPSEPWVCMGGWCDVTVCPVGGGKATKKMQVLYQKTHPVTWQCFTNVGIN